MVKFTHQDYASEKNVLAFPDHYVAIGVKHDKATSGTPGLAVLVDGHYIVKAGTIYPANDGTAIGVVMHDVDVTLGDEQLAVIIHGYIKLSAIPAVPAAAAIAALKQISFLPIAPFQTVALSCTKAAIAVGSTTATTVTVAIDNATFRDAATTLANWTFTAEAGTKVTVSAPVLSTDKKSITFTLTPATAVAGTVTARPAASVISINSQPAAVDIATVA